MIQIVCITQIYCQKRRGFNNILLTDDDFDLVRNDRPERIDIYDINSNYLCSEYKHHFIKLSKWRENQINSILDEEE